MRPMFLEYPADMETFSTDAQFMFGSELLVADFVRRGEEQKLIDRYRVQLEDYAQALERMTGRKVKERYIYSFTLGKEILL